MSQKFTKVATIARALLWASGAFWTTPAIAEGAASPAPTVEHIDKRDVSQLNVAPAETGLMAPARITIGAANAPEGAMRYPRRSRLGNTATISISATPDIVRRSAPGGGEMALPLAAMRLTSRFGLRQHPVYGGIRAHSGVDLAAVAGAPISATRAGRVAFAGWSGGYGLMVTVDHGEGLQTRYGHLSRLDVAAGQAVAAGDVVGRAGSTGVSTGTHLHYEVRLNGVAINPLIAHP